MLVPQGAQPRGAPHTSSTTSACSPYRQHDLHVPLKHYAAPIAAAWSRGTTYTTPLLMVFTSSCSIHTPWTKKITRYGPQFTRHRPQFTHHGPQFTCHGPQFTRHRPQFTRHETKLTRHVPQFTCAVLLRAFPHKLLGRIEHAPRLRPLQTISNSISCCRRSSSSWRAHACDVVIAASARLRLLGDSHPMGALRHNGSS